MNLGGPATLQDVGPFLDRLFSDRDIIQLPIQFISGPTISRFRTPKIEKLYKEIGGGSPIRSWTEKQGDQLERLLDQLSPETAPHRYYIGFRYADPLSSEALLKMKEDGVERAVAFTQYPQYSCTTTGSSLNELWSQSKLLGLENQIKWSVIDRWFSHPDFVKTVASKVREGLAKFPTDQDRDDAVILFSAHSLPIKVIDRGDPYPQEVASTVHLVMNQLKDPGRKYMLCYQSQVGAVPWLGAQTDKVLEGLGTQGHRNVLVVPIAFTSDHIETLHEIDIEFAEVAHKAGITNFIRAPSLNDDPNLAAAMANIVISHLKSNESCSSMYRFKCPGCHTPEKCRQILN
eukprot:CAMPEP_0174238566 /NCGR_PEP_ID=MMETSP0417-20130205/11726_1 /TAXON_ID=242541 /ORGANISM="Mayorella sp, Strain BSH-02190019" /LENGTH=345 /DNA_ID=CAMNT_0015317417 /DNA_START=281 /DNA_END=1315 /DNA_ORIENTATION=+